MSKSAKQIAEILKNRAAKNTGTETTANESPETTKTPIVNETPIVNASETATVATAPAAPVKLSDLEARMKALYAQMEALKTAKRDAVTARHQLFADKLAEFIPSVGCADLAEFADAFRQYRTGLANGTGVSRSKVTDAERDAVRAIYRRAKAPDATPEEKKNVNLSVIAEAKGISYQNIRNWLIASGDIQVQKRL